MESPSTLYPKKVTLTNCDKEPIHLIGNIQGFGVLLASDLKTDRIAFYSENCLAFFDKTKEEIETFSLNDLIPEQYVNRVKESLNTDYKIHIKATLSEENYLIISHRNDTHLILEIEKDENQIDTLLFQEQLTNIIEVFSTASTPLAMCNTAAELIKDIFDYDRVMIYKFDQDWNGEVIAEQKESHLESWLGLHYPASDIPQQARKLFLKQGVRIIEDVSSEPIPILPANRKTSVSLDLSKSELRSVSPIHIEYLRNMGVKATLTAAIIFQGNLWGLIACHHYTPRYSNYHLRLSCKFITQVFATQLGLRNTNWLLEKTNLSNETRSLLIEQMSQDWNIIEGLTAGKQTFLDVTEAIGGAIYIDGKIKVLGQAPNNHIIHEIIEVCHNLQQSGIYKTSSLSIDYKQFKSIKKFTSGVLCMFISPKKKNALIWFKPEIIQTVSWGGNPNKSVVKDNNQISPRKSFEKWSEEKEGYSLPWQDYEIAAAIALKDHIAEVIIEKYDKMKNLNDQLKKAYKELETFSYSVSHDLRSPLRGIDGFAQIIKEDYFDSLDSYGKQAVNTIISSTQKMNVLIDDILSFSSLGKKSTEFKEVNMNILVEEVLQYLQVSNLHPNTKLEINYLPQIIGDKTMIFQLMSNLISNAFKYSSKAKNPIVEIGCNASSFYVKDNGIGFNAKHEDRIFGIFSRLVNDEYEGSGIGLAIAKRVIEKHNGQIWTEAQLGKGASFYFNLNTNKNE
ncbi:ATP-binding protein [Aquimarina spongiae]|uniref:histidine kinase n=1 Tax=Aquimarina spongiae TaxID=570521 RepID=A0A1M6GP79_9FLAO|nr:ATP-binding protein [Aquimarina spongiae]SHJ11739.1 multi-sensor signal transduction histidine kinase [Aquimarina spongiae]